MGSMSLATRCNANSSSRFVIATHIISFLNSRITDELLTSSRLQPLRPPVRISGRALHVGKLVVTC